MGRTRGLLWLAIASVVGAGGCSDDSALADACNAYAHVFRTRENQCYGVPPEPDLADLTAREVRSCEALSTAPGSNVTASYWSACAVAADNDCGAYSCPYPDGMGGPDQACLLSVQCASLWCKGVDVRAADGSVLRGAAQCGTCATRLTEGSACDVNTDVCDIGMSCFAGTCRLRGATGAACASSSDCASSNVCHSDGTCAPVLQVGDSCAASTECTTDVGCDLTTGLCASVQFGQPGDACDGEVHRCEAGRCDRNTFVCPIVIADGAPCDPTDPSTTCDTYAACFEGVCRLPEPTRCQ